MQTFIIGAKKGAKKAATTKVQKKAAKTEKRIERKQAVEVRKLAKKNPTAPVTVKTDNGNITVPAQTAQKLIKQTPAKQRQAKRAAAKAVRVEKREVKKTEKVQKRETRKAEKQTKKDTRQLEKQNKQAQRAATKENRQKEKELERIEDMNRDRPVLIETDDGPAIFKPGELERNNFDLRQPDESFFDETDFAQPENNVRPGFDCNNPKFRAGTLTEAEMDICEQQNAGVEVNSTQTYYILGGLLLAAYLASK